MNVLCVFKSLSIILLIGKLTNMGALLLAGPACRRNKDRKSESDSQDHTSLEN